jgi:hypothetical protein
MKNLAELHHPPDTREHHIRMARIYIFEAHKTMHRSWAFTLLTWAAERRRKALRIWWTTPRNTQPSKLRLCGLRCGR